MGGIKPYHGIVSARCWHPIVHARLVLIVYHSQAQLGIYMTNTLQLCSYVECDRTGLGARLELQLI